MEYIAHSAVGPNKLNNVTSCITYYCLSFLYYNFTMLHFPSIFNVSLNGKATKQMIQDIYYELHLYYRPYNKKNIPKIFNI